MAKQKTRREISNAASEDIGHLRSKISHEDDNLKQYVEEHILKHLRCIALRNAEKLEYTANIQHEEDGRQYLVIQASTEPLDGVDKDDPICQTIFHHIWNNGEIGTMETISGVLPLTKLIQLMEDHGLEAGVATNSDIPEDENPYFNSETPKMIMVNISNDKAIKQLQAVATQIEQAYKISLGARDIPAPELKDLNVMTALDKAPGISSP